MAFKLPPFPTEYLEITFLDEQTDVENYVKLQQEQTLPFAVSGKINCPLISAKYLSQGYDVKRVIEICVNIEDVDYQPGYTFGIIPENNIDEVNKIIERLKLTEIADKLFAVSVKETNTKNKNKIPIHIPVIGTIRQLLLHNLDIRSIPKKLFLRALRKYTTNEEETQILDELCNQQVSTKYTDFISEFMPLMEILNKFPSCFPPFTILLEHLPRLLPRPYSVTSSPNEFDPPSSKVKFIFNEIELPKNYKGVCSDWLFSLVNGFLNSTIKPVIPLYLRKANNFILPEDKTKNIILVANGTGLAPFISFLNHVNLEEKRRKIWLFYGCRYSDRDFLYKNEIEEYLKSGVINKLFTSFSREVSPNSNIKYVQDNIRLHAIEFIEFFDNNAVLYVCGGKQMTNDVFETIAECVLETKKCSIENARKFLNDLKFNNNYIEDIWN